MPNWCDPPPAPRGLVCACSCQTMTQARPKAPEGHPGSQLGKKTRLFSPCRPDMGQSLRVGPLKGGGGFGDTLSKDPGEEEVAWDLGVDLGHSGSNSGPSFIYHSTSPRKKKPGGLCEYT